MPIRHAASLLAVTATLALPGLAAGAPGATAALKDGAGKAVGTATFESTSAGVTVTLHVAGLSPGPHGWHVHAVGACEGPDFKSAGGHFNPGGKKHGLANPEGHHGGDLPNLVVGADGHGMATARLDGVTLGEGEASLLRAGGTALVVHADADDEKTDPAGNSGPRVACGVIEKK